jgi:purine-binding chemotaxis protein CheW
MSQYLTFTLNSEFYGVPIESVREINRVGEITPVPKTPEFVKGVMNLRGKIIPVINLRVKFGMSEVAYNRDTCIIVIDTLTGQVGMIVDAVKEVVDLRNDQIEPPPPLGNQVAKEFVRGLGKQESKVVILVDVSATLKHDDLSNLEETHAA